MGRLKCAYTCTGISTTLSLRPFGTPYSAPSLSFDSALVLGYKGKAAWISTWKRGDFDTMRKDSWGGSENFLKNIIPYSIFLHNTTMCVVCPHTTKENRNPRNSTEDLSSPVVQRIIITCGLLTAL